MTRRWSLVLPVVLLAVIAAWLGCPSSSGADEVKLGRAAPELAGGPWINSAALTTSALRGRVTLVEFWTYG